MRTLRAAVVGAVFAAAGLSICPTFEDEPSLETTTTTTDSSTQQLIQNYGPASAQFALEVIKNGKRVKAHSLKDAAFAESEQIIRNQHPFRPLRLFGFCDEDRETAQIAALHQAQQQVLQANTKYKERLHLPMSFIVAVLSAEGHSLDLDHPSHRGLNGFQNFGNDTFGSEFDRITRTGLISEDFANQFEVTQHTNEKGQQVASAKFASRDAAFQAAVTMLAYNQHLLYRDLEKNGISPDHLSDDEKLFYTYWYYNTGPNSIDERLISKEAVHDFFSRQNQSPSRMNAFMVLNGAKWLDMNGIFQVAEPDPTMWWRKYPPNAVIAQAPTTQQNL